MFSHNGHSEHHFIENQMDAIRDSVKKLYEQIVEPPPTRLRSFADKATDLVKAHPIAFAGAALGIGYVVTKIVRR